MRREKKNCEKNTVGNREIGTGISEASKRVPIFPFDTQASKRVPIFDRGTGSKPERLRSGSLQADLGLIERSRVCNEDVTCPVSLRVFED